MTMTAQSPVVYSFLSGEELAKELADEVARFLTEAIRHRNKASLVVSGGSTPKPLFNHLSQKKIDWRKVTITLADERWVDPSNPESNEYLVRSQLLLSEAAAATFIGLKNEAPTPYDGEEQCNARLEAIGSPFDLVILGMGGDGHTASLFPQAERLPEAVNMHSRRKCTAITPPEAPHERMTMTLPALLDSRRIIVHITGEDKKQILDKAIAEGAAEDMPIRYILRQQKTPVHIFWAP